MTWHKTFWYMPDDYGPQQVEAYTEDQFLKDKKACRELGYEFLIDRDDMLLVKEGYTSYNTVYILYMKEGVISVTS